MKVSELSQRLAERAEEVCQRLLPSGKQQRGEWVCGSTAGNEGDSLKIHLTGAHAGEWRDWANQEERGDLVDLWRICRGISAGEALAEIRSFLGIRDPYAASERQWKRPGVNGCKPLAPEGEAIKYLRDVRKIDPAIINRFRIEGYLEENKRAIVFPCYSPSGELINRSYRTLGAEKKVWQDTGCAPCLFGWQGLSDRAYRERAVILSEGQLDCASWTQWGFDCLSIPNGSGMSWIEYEWKNLEAFDQIYIAFDMDPAGEEMRQKAIARLGKHRCMIVKMPKKDANECLMGGMTKNEAGELLGAAEAPQMANLTAVSNLRDRLIRSADPGPEVPTLPFLRFRWPNAGWFPRPAEVTIWSGEMNQGKSSLLNFFVGTMLMKKVRVFICSLETKAEIVTRKIITSISNNSIDSGAIDAFLKQFGTDLFFSDTVGYIKQEELLEVMRFSFYRYGVTQFVVDSLMRIEGLEENYPAQGDFLNHLQKFAKETDSHVHLVAHNRKPSTGEKGNSGLRIKGSSLIPNNADNILSVSRNPEKEKLRDASRLTPEKDAEMHDAEVRISKQRETGWQGKVNLKYYPDTGYFTKWGTGSFKP